LLAFVLLVALFAVTPTIGRWVATANASTIGMTTQPEGVHSPANDNEDEAALCDSGNPRKQKKCNYNAPNVDNDNDGNVAGDRPSVNVAVSNNDPNDGDTINFTVSASGNNLDQVWWWVPDYAGQNDNDNDSFAFSTEAHTVGCGGNDRCSESSDLNTAVPDTFTIHAQARDHDGRLSDEFVTEVRVHDN
jgi:hypothetical protein